jgi:hypothetical protein
MRLDLTDQDASLIADILEGRRHDLEWRIRANPTRRANKLSALVIESFNVELDAINNLLARMGRE